MLFKILQGSSSRIDTATTPLHEGYAYFTPDTAGFYIDASRDGVVERIQINPDELFWATPEQTTLTEIGNAISNGRLPVAVNSTGDIYTLSKYDGTTAEFMQVNVGSDSAVAVSIYQVTSSGWTLKEYVLPDANAITTTHASVSGHTLVISTENAAI